MKKVFLGVIVSVLWATAAMAEVSIETSVSRSLLGVGEELRLDIIVSNATGRIQKPTFTSVEGFTSYSQGHSQELSIINGRSSSRSIFSYVLVANTVGKKTIGPFEIKISDKTYKVAPVEVEVVPYSAASPVATVPPGVAPASPPSRALPTGDVSNQDIFVRTWLDKDEITVNEPAILTYTLYTRLSATYKGFEKEPVTTGFWIEDFPPDKTIRRTEKIINGTRYVVADVRKIALFPTEIGIFTIEPGVLAATVELRDRDDFDSFFSYNIFGRRSTMFPPAFTSQIVSKVLPAEPVTLTVKALPEENRPKSFGGAVGDYRIDSSIDKREVEAGNPVTYRIKIEGFGNLNTVQAPSLPALEDFKVYDSSASANIRKENLVVEGTKTVETVIVPKKAGAYTIPALEFSYFDLNEKAYKTLKTRPHALTVKPAPVEEVVPESFPPLPAAGFSEPVTTLRDIRYIKTLDLGPAIRKPLYRRPLYWFLNAALVLAVLLLGFGARLGSALGASARGPRFGLSHRVARRKLAQAEAFLRRGKIEEFYSEASKAVYGYFAERLHAPAQSVTLELIEEKLPARADKEAILADTRALFDELGQARFGLATKSQAEMRAVYEKADRVISLFEKVKK